MTDGFDKAPTFYPAFYFNASPTYNTWVKLTAAGFHSLQSRKGFEGQGVYFYGNHPICFVVVTGIVVDFEPNNAYWLFHVDDGSGALVEVVLARPREEKVPLARPGEAIAPVAQGKKGVSEQGSHIDMNGIDIGKCVKVRGTIREFRDTKQISLERLAHMQSTTEELLAWEAGVAQFQGILCKPWVLTRRERAKIRDSIRRSSKHKSGDNERHREESD